MFPSQKIQLEHVMGYEEVETMTRGISFEKINCKRSRQISW